MSRQDGRTERSCSAPTGAVVARDHGAVVSGRSNPASEPLSSDWGTHVGGEVGPFAWGHLLRFKWTILLAFVVVAGSSLAAIWALMIPGYRAAAEIRVRPIIPRVVFKTEDNGLIPLYQSYLNTQVSVIRSPTVLQRVLDQTDVQQTDWYRNPPRSVFRTMQPALDRLRDGLAVRPRGQTEVIDVSMTLPNARDAAVIVNAVLDQYVRYVSERSEQTDDMLYRKLSEELSSLENEIQGREKVAARLRKELGTGAPDELIAQRRVRLDEMEAKLEQLRRQIATVDYQEKELTRIAEQPTSAPTSNPAPPDKLFYEQDPEWRKLRIDLKTAQHRVEVERGRLGDAHPAMTDLKDQVVLYEELLKAREHQLDLQRSVQRTPPVEAEAVTGRSAPDELRVARQRLQLLKCEEQLLVEDTRKQKASFDRAFDSAQMLMKEEEAIRRSRELYEAVRTRLDQKSMERNVPGSIEILAKAFPASQPDKDRRPVFSIMAVVAALGVGVGIGFLRAVRDRTICEVNELPRNIRAPFLGQLPFIQDTAAVPPQMNSIRNEYVRMLRTALLERLDGTHGSTVLVTSSGAGSGKTTVAIMLSRSLAQCGKQVLLVDTDLRNPSVAGRLGMETGPGLVSLLRGESSDDQVIVHSDMPHFDVLPAGATLPEDTELLANGAFSACLRRWRDRYDIVMLDASPVLPVADARILSKQADGTILVVRERHCLRADVVDGLACLITAGARLLGTVFIGSGHHGRHGYGYYTYYTSTAVTHSNGESA